LHNQFQITKSEVTRESSRIYKDESRIKLKLENLKSICHNLKFQGNVWFFHGKLQLHSTFNFKLRKVKSPVMLLGRGYRDEIGTVGWAVGGGELGRRGEAKVGTLIEVVIV